MKPAIEKVEVFDDKGEATATVCGPIDLDGSESDVYLWVRASTVDPHAKVGTTTTATNEAEAIGADELDLDHHGRQAPPTMWTATMPVEGAFEVGTNVFVEAWALVRSANQQREFHVYWYDNDVPVEQGTDIPVETGEAAVGQT